MKHVNALIGAMEMAETPLEMRQKMASVNRELDTMQGTLPSGEQAAFSQFRDNVNDRMHDRLARLQVEQQQLRKSGEGGSADGAQEKVAKSRDLPTREAEQTPERQVETDKSKPGPSQRMLINKKRVELKNRTERRSAVRTRIMSVRKKAGQPGLFYPSITSGSTFLIASRLRS